MLTPSVLYLTLSRQVKGSSPHLSHPLLVTPCVILRAISPGQPQKVEPP